MLLSISILGELMLQSWGLIGIDTTVVQGRMDASTVRKILDTACETALVNDRSFNGSHLLMGH